MYNFNRALKLVQHFGTVFESNAVVNQVNENVIDLDVVE